MKVPKRLLDTVREFVRLTSEHCNVSEADAVKLVGRALAEVAIEVATDGVADEIVASLFSR